MHKTVEESSGKSGAMSFLDHILAEEMANGKDRFMALIDISADIDREGMYGFAKRRRVLDSKNSAEAFSIQFMTAYNDEVGIKY